MGGHAVRLFPIYIRAHETNINHCKRYSKMTNMRYLSGESEDIDAMWSDRSLHPVSGYKNEIEDGTFRR
jgi:hypothetical protein